MAQFVELENGNFFNVSCIMELHADVRVNINSAEKCKVEAAINILTENGTMRTLVSGIGEAPWMDSEDVELYEIVCNEVELYEIVCNEREVVERETRNFFVAISRLITHDKLLYFSPSLEIREELQLIAKKAAERITYEAHQEGAKNE